MHDDAIKTKVICCFPGVLKSDFIEAAENFFGCSILDASTAEYQQRAFDKYKTELSGTQLLMSLIRAIEVDYLEGDYDVIFVPIMQSFVGKLEDRVPLTIITLHQNDIDKIIKNGATFGNRDLIRLYEECNTILKTLGPNSNVSIFELPEGERRIPHPDLLEYYI